MFEVYHSGFGSQQRRGPTVDINVRCAGGQKVEATVKDYTVITDQPVATGGEGSAPSTFDLFLASIATCAGVYVYQFCMQRDIPVENVGLVMRTERNQETGMLDRIGIEVRLPSDFPRKYEWAVLRAVDLCAVKKHLMDPPEIQTYTTYP